MKQQQAQEKDEMIHINKYEIHSHTYITSLR